MNLGVGPLVLENTLGCDHPELAIWLENRYYDHSVFPLYSINIEPSPYDFPPVVIKER